MSGGRPALAAHRGGAALWPENSLTAFRRSIELGVDLVELDVRLSADGQVVVIHDGTLARTTTGSGPVDGHTAAALAAVRLKGPDGVEVGEGVPTLRQVLDLLAPTRTGLLLEIKSPGVNARYERREGRVEAIGGPRLDGLEEGCVAALEEAGLSGRTRVMAFNPDVVRRLGAMAPETRRTLLVAAGHVSTAQATADETVQWAMDVGATDVGLEHTLLDASVMARARGGGIAVGVWTVNDEAAMRRAIDLGVDVLTTDRPDLARRVLGR